MDELPLAEEVKRVREALERAAATLKAYEVALQSHPVADTTPTLELARYLGDVHTRLAGMYDRMMDIQRER